MMIAIKLGKWWQDYSTGHKEHLLQRLALFLQIHAQKGFISSIVNWARFLPIPSNTLGPLINLQYQFWKLKALNNANNKDFIPTPYIEKNE